MISATATGLSFHGGNHTSPKCKCGSHEHYKAVHPWHGKRDCGQGTSHPWSMLQMAVRIVSQQKSDPRLPSTCMYGRYLMRLLCWIVAAKGKFPKAPIALKKINIKSAYRRCHLNTITAMQTITQLLNNKLGIIMLCLTFGGAPCPFEWNILLGSIRDLANKTLFDEN